MVRLSGAYAAPGGMPVRHKRPLCRKAVQFCYDHPDFDKTLACIRKSADEVNKMLNKMCEKEKKKEKVKK